MKTITVETYLDGVNAIYREQPEYALGHDGSDGKCDCIGMCKGAIRRGGGDADGLSGTNYAARYTIRNLSRISGVSALSVGDVVLKGRKPGEPGYSLPEKYKTGSDLTDYYHIGTVTQVNPLRITHMTTPTAKIDSTLGKWAYFGQLPQVAGTSPTPSPVLPVLRRGDRGAYVTLAQTKLIQKGFKCGSSGADGVYGQATENAVREFQWANSLDVDGIIGARTWAKLNDPASDGELYTVTIDGLTESQADALIQQFPNAIKGRG